MKVVGLYALATVALVAVVGWLMTLAFTGARDAAAVSLSAVVAVVVQTAAFAVTRLWGGGAGKQVLAAWGAGAVIRLFTLIIYALAAVKLLALPAAPALLSLVTFFFITTLIEPLLLRR